MGMTDSQFKSYIRFALDDIEEALAALAAQNLEELQRKLGKLQANLQKSLED